VGAGYDYATGQMWDAFGGTDITTGRSEACVAGSTATLAATVLVWSTGEIVSQPLAAAYVADIAPAHLTGRYQGAFAFTSGLGLPLRRCRQ
jgi:dipeptide/tripeptide permease